MEAEASSIQNTMPKAENYVEPPPTVHTNYDEPQPLLPVNAEAVEDNQEPPIDELSPLMINPFDSPGIPELHI